MWVVKLGGSLAFSDHLRAWVDRLAARSDLVLVPGGGTFTDQVRLAQARWGFDDSAAHHMALLGMEQFGRMLCALHSGLSPAASASEIRRLLHQGVTPVWMPVGMVLDDPDIPKSWDVTSDSLAAWLCRRLGAAALLLVKSVSIPEAGLSLDEMARRNIVDPAFPFEARLAAVAVHVLSARDFNRLVELVRQRSIPPTDRPAGLRGNA